MPEKDALGELVLRLAMSYGTLPVLVLAIVGGLKMAVGWIKGREVYVALAVTFLIGILAKIAFPDVYGPHTMSSWAAHAIVLLAIACGAKVGHDAVSSPVAKIVKALMVRPPVSEAGETPKEEEAHEDP